MSLEQIFDLMDENIKKLDKLIIKKSPAKTGIIKMKDEVFKKRVVKIKSIDGLAPNIASYLTGKLITVGEKILAEKLYYIVENSKGIKVKVLASNCEFKKQVKLKKENK